MARRSDAASPRCAVCARQRSMAARSAGRNTSPPAPMRGLPVLHGLLELSGLLVQVRPGLQQHRPLRARLRQLAEGLRQLLGGQAPLAHRLQGLHEVGQQGRVLGDEAPGSPKQLGGVARRGPGCCGRSRPPGAAARLVLSGPPRRSDSSTRAEARRSQACRLR